MNSSATQTQQLAARPSTTHWVSLRYFCATRLAVVFLLFGATFFTSHRTSLSITDSSFFFEMLLVYGLSSAGFLALTFFERRRFYLQLWAQLVCDIGLMTLLISSSGGSSSSLTVLFLLPVAGAAILSPAPLALFFAALSALAILGESLWREMHSEIENVNFIQAGLYGVASFALALVINRLAARLMAQELIAKQRGQDLQGQIEINRVIVADMQDGVLILSHQGRLHSLNPAAARMLQIKNRSKFVASGWHSHVAGIEIVQHFLAWYAKSRYESITIDIAFPLADEQRRLRLRFMPPPLNHPPDGDYVVFLEDLLHIEEQAQQLKLASMGRLTASIAHEIRNPLAAISYATGLMSEESTSLSQLRLLNIVQDNTKRLNRTVESVLQLVRRGTVEPEAIQLTSYLRKFIEEFCRDQGCVLQTIDLIIDRNPVIDFNAEHLWQVLMNLLQNAQRYATGQPGSFCISVVPVKKIHPNSVQTDRSKQRIELIIQDDGPGIRREIRAHLFEPFFTTSNLGTGLGLYLARELCIVNGATLNYVANNEQGTQGRFVINVCGTLN